MTTYQIPAALHTAINRIAKQTMDTTAAALAEKYGFDAAEAQRFLESRPKTDEAEANTKGKAKGKGKGKAMVVEASADGVKPKAKRGPTGYLMFSSENRQVVKEELMAQLDDGAKLSPQAVVKELAARWKALGTDEQAKYKDKAKTPPVSSDSE